MPGPGEAMAERMDGPLGVGPKASPHREQHARCAQGQRRLSGQGDAGARRAGGLIPGAQARIDRAMSVTIAREQDVVNSRIPFLATVGSTAPFIGLFGTVWGIKNAFEEIAIQQNTNLAVVAPGIAEALVATALGLLAAIPAVIFYNKLSGDADDLVGRMENFADEFSTILNRQMERKEA